MASVARESRGISIRVTVVDESGDVVDLSVPSVVLLILRNARQRWEITPTLVGGGTGGELTADLPDEAWRRVDEVTWTIRVIYGAGTRYHTPTVRITVTDPL